MHAYAGLTRTPTQELTYIIKQDIAGVNKQIAVLQAHVRQHGAGGARSPDQKQADEHEANVVMLLQSKLAAASMAFKDVLELRTQASLSLVGDERCSHVCRT
jgi:syntaxin 5